MISSQEQDMTGNSAAPISFFSTEKHVRVCAKQIQM